MPINYKEYHPDWKAISLRIRKERAGDKCEWCQVPNGSLGNRGKDGKWYTEDQIHGMNSDCGYALFGHLPNPFRTFRIVLTVAHIDHDKANNEESNLAALCQRCHLNHDRDQHAENRRKNLNSKRGQIGLDL
jgi:hypothetical protein